MTYSQRTLGSRHVYQRKFYIGHVFEKTSAEDKAEYTTRCSCVSSSWKIAMILKKDPPFDNFKIFVNLLRVDSGGFRLRADLQIWLMDANGKRCPEIYRLKCSLNSHKMASKMFVLSEHSTCSYKCLLQEGRGTLPRDFLVVKYALNVSGCHRFRSRVEGRDPISSGSEGLNRTCLSKL